MSGGGDDSHRKPATRVVRGGRRPEWTGPVVNPPVWRASTHLYASDADRRAAGKSNTDGQFFYGRRGAPTQWALADALTALEEGAHGTVLYPSGVAAIAGAMLAVLKPGERLLMADNAYDPTRSMALGLLARLGVQTTFFDPRDLTGFASLVEGAQAVWLEAPGSLTFEMCDVPALAAMARAAGAVTILDNTWASPLGFSALTHGCDIVMMSLSKHVGGHSDLMMGSASAGKRWYTALRRVSQELGQVVSPDDAALAARGLRTMGVRLEAQTKSALAIAQWLEAQPQVARVACPMLPSDPGHALWARDFTGGCGLFSFVLASDDPSASARVVDALELFGIGYSWGGYESLALAITPEDYRSCMSGTGGAPAIRLSIGLEDTGDLIADLGQGLKQI